MEKDNFDFLRPFKALQSRETYKNLKDKTGHLKVQKYDNCTLSVDYFWGNQQNSDGDNSFVRNGVRVECSSASTIKHFPAKKHFGGKVLFGGFFIDGWGHFLVETMARMWYLYQSDAEKIDKIIFVSDNINGSPIRGNIKRFLELAGLLNRIEILTTNVVCDRLIVPEMAITHFWYAKEFISVFDSVRTAVLKNNLSQKNTYSKIFFTRSKLKNAKQNEINIQYLDRFFDENGYKIISPERISLDQLILDLESASELCSINGTLAHNILFAPRGIRFNIIERHGFINSWQMVCNIVSLTPATYVDCYELPAMSNPIGFLFLYQSTEYMRNWAIHNGLREPRFPSSKKDRKKELRRFLRRCKLANGHTPYILPYDIKRGPVYAEAINECESIYSKWTRRKAPLFLSDYFSLSCNMNWWIRPLMHKLRGFYRSTVKVIVHRYH